MDWPATPMCRTRSAALRQWRPHPQAAKPGLEPHVSPDGVGHAWKMSVDVGPAAFEVVVLTWTLCQWFVAAPLPVALTLGAT